MTHKADSEELKKNLVDWAKVGFWICVQLLAGYRYVESINVRMEVLTSKFEERAADWKEMRGEVKKLADSTIKTETQLEALRILSQRVDNNESRLITLEQAAMNRFREKK